MSGCRSSLTRSVLSAPSGCSYRQQVGRVSWAGVTEKQNLTSTSNADQGLKLILTLCAPRCVLQQEQKIFMGLVKKNPKPSRLKSSSQWHQAKGKPQADKRQSKTMVCHSVEGSHTLQFKHILGKEKAMQRSFSTASGEVCDGCTGLCQRPNTTPGTWTKSVHWDKQSGYKWHFKSTNQWHTTCQLWASHFCHYIPTSCSYSSLLFASWEDLQSQPAVLRAT